MTLISVILILVCAMVLAVVCGALVEVFRQLADVRTVLRLDDRPLPLQLERPDEDVTALGFPDELALLPEAILVFLSARCASCFSIAHSFKGGAPDSVWFVLEADGSDVEKIREPLKQSAERIVVDRDGGLAHAVGVEITPAVVSLEYGRVSSARAVSSFRQVTSLVPAVTPRVAESGVRDHGLLVADGRATARP
jgi:hypothetical protein